jgi:hypothetical protein
VPGVGTVDDYEDRTLSGQMFQRQPPLLELVEVFWARGEEDRHRRVRHAGLSA